MRNRNCFSFKVSQEQIDYTKKLVDYSIKNHPVTDIFAKKMPDSYGLYDKERSTAYRFRGTLGEVVFADAYGLPRPTRSFGAIDGQDYGRDFTMVIDGKPVNVDLKTMWRNSDIQDYYVLDLSARQLEKKDSKTDYYFHITLSGKRENPDDIRACFVGYIPKDEITQYGEFFPAGSLRKNDYGKDIQFDHNTYEIMLGDFVSPPTAINEGLLPEFKSIFLFQTNKYCERRQRLDSLKNNQVIRCQTF